MKKKDTIIPKAIDEYTDNLTWELDDGSPAVWEGSLISDDALSV